MKGARCQGQDRVGLGATGREVKSQVLHSNKLLKTNFFNSVMRGWCERVAVIRR